MCVHLMCDIEIVDVICTWCDMCSCGVMCVHVMIHMWCDVRACDDAHVVRVV